MPEAAYSTCAAQGVVCLADSRVMAYQAASATQAASELPHNLFQQINSEFCSQNVFAKCYFHIYFAF